MVCSNDEVVSLVDRLLLAADLAQPGDVILILMGVPIAERPLELLLPGFICASAAMNRVVEQIQRLRGHNLTVLITGERGR